MVCFNFSSVQGLSFLFPLLRVQADIWKQIQADPNPSSLYKWIRENVATNLHTNKGFVNALTTRWVPWTLIFAQIVILAYSI